MQAPSETEARATNQRWWFSGDALYLARDAEDEHGKVITEYAQMDWDACAVRWQTDVKAWDGPVDGALWEVLDVSWRVR